VAQQKQASIAIAAPFPWMIGPEQKQTSVIRASSKIFESGVPPEMRGNPDLFSAWPSEGIA